MSSVSNPPSWFHAWLSRHKILFETVAVTCITLAAVFVSYLQWKTASLQAAISLKQVQPNFVVSCRQIWNAEAGRVTDDELQIQNFGGAPRELHHQYATILHFT